MDVSPYVERVQAQLTATAALGDDATRKVADTLATAAEPAVRLAVLAAATAVADDITVALLDSPGAPSVAVRLDGDGIRVDVQTTYAGDEPVDVPDDDATARVSLRLPEALKAQVDAAARRDGVSVNTWLVRAATSALSGSAPRGPRAGGNHPQRLTGWINS
jgi:hypothetical protein